MWNVYETVLPVFGQETSRSVLILKPFPQHPLLVGPLTQFGVTLDVVLAELGVLEL
jgi:hypothetical protein